MDDDLTTPDLTNVPEDDDAEPRDAEITHQASVEAVEGVEDSEPQPVPDQTPPKESDPDPIPAERVTPKKTTQKRGKH